ncbi:MAG: hypothetical protein ACRCYP_01620 [Alphaproteobacteria bacterium]
MTEFKNVSINLSEDEAKPKHKFEAYFRKLNDNHSPYFIPGSGFQTKDSGIFPIDTNRSDRDD